MGCSQEVKALDFDSSIRGFDTHQPSQKRVFSKKEVKEVNAIYLRDEAALIIEKFELILSQYNIHVPSPQDGERDDENMIGLYGSTYFDLLDSIEDQLYSLLNQHKNGKRIIKEKFSSMI